ncbi:MAG: NADH-quinone oxidoreductase subunit B [Peptococcaceae bacterium]|nr:NADH-quinone oxidoreductase subunit B [Peptococcaceae bacterium]
MDVKDKHPVEELTNDPAVVDEVKRIVRIAPLEKLLNIARAHSLWPFGFGLACCAIEGLMAANMPRFDLARFGYEVMRGSPRQADVMLVAGTVTHKAAPFVVRLYEQMSEPKWVIAMGSCAISGGPFVDSYHVVPGVDKLIPVDAYIPGCPPRPEAVIEAWLMIKKKILDPKVVSKVRG